MEEFINWFNDSQWLNLIFLSIAILSIFISIYLFGKSGKLKRNLFLINEVSMLFQIQ